MSGRATIVRAVAVSSVVLALSTTVSACGESSTGGGGPTAQTPTSSSESPATAPTATTTPAPTSTPAPTTSTSEPTTSPSDTSGEAEPTELTPVAGGQRLTLDRFFNAQNYWEENRYDVATSSDVQGIAATVDTCTGTGYGVKELELRLENKFDALSFTAGQGNDSVRSDQHLSIEVLANNAQVDIRSIPFNELRDFEIPVDGVNALKIRLFLDDEIAECGGSVVGVIMDPILQ